MVAQKGRDILVKVGTGVSPTVYNTLMGGRSKSMVINNDLVDITSDDEAPWRTLLADAGLRSVSVTISGVFKDDAALQQARGYALDGSIQSFQVSFGNGDLLDMEAQVSSLEESGEHVGEQTYSLTLESSGQASFIPA